MIFCVFLFLSTTIICAKQTEYERVARFFNHGLTAGTVAEYIYSSGIDYMSQEDSYVNKFKVKNGSREPKKLSKAQVTFCNFMGLISGTMLNRQSSDLLDLLYGKSRHPLELLPSSFGASAGGLLGAAIADCFGFSLNSKTAKLAAFLGGGISGVVIDELQERYCASKCSDSTSSNSLPEQQKKQSSEMNKLEQYISARKEKRDAK